MLDLVKLMSSPIALPLQARLWEKRFAGAKSLQKALMIGNARFDARCARWRKYGAERGDAVFIFARPADDKRTTWTPSLNSRAS
jgi:hypothetical protein